VLPTAPSVTTLPTTDGPIAATANDQDLATASDPLIGISGASTGQNDGSLLSAGALSGGETGSVTLNAPTGTPGQ
jgi:hypothetical protein